MNRLHVPFAIAGLLTLPTMSTAQVLTPEQERSIAEVFEDLDDPGSPGASVAVIRDGRVVFSAGYGSAQIEYGIPVEPATIFHVASVSKQFTAMALLLLEADGELSLDDDIRDHMPDVPDMGGVITARHLLQHTSGVRDQWELLAMAGWRLDDVITKAHVRRLLRNQRELNFEPGAEYLYSNMGYSLAADLVEAVSGMSFADFARERIFEPLGMADTHVHDDHEMVVPNRAYSYAASDDGYRKRVLSYANHGATSLFTTAEDLTKWLDNFRTMQVGSREVRRSMTTRAVLNDGERVGYALGVGIGTYKEQPVVEHGGADAGFRSQAMWFPGERVGIAVLSNLASASPGGRARRVADIVLGLPADDEVTPDTEGEADDEVAGVEVPADILASYEGRFRTPMISLSFEVRDGALWLTTPEETVLTARGESEFTFEDVTVRFHREGTTTDSLTATQGDLRLAGVRMEQLTLDDPAEYVGTYYSPEIETLYEIREDDDGLIVHHLRHGELPIVIGDEADLFTGGPFFLQELRFTRGEGARVDGFRLTGGRVRNLRFVRLESPLPG